jgi:hypothetical protein
MAEIQSRRREAGRNLTAFLREWARRPFAWGVCDCCLFLADWIVYCGGDDPAADLRGTYSTERGMRRLLKARGGIEQVVAGCAARAHLTPTSAPQRGDVGLVKVAIKLWRGRAVLVPVGAIALDHKLWAIKPRERGLIIQPFPLLRAWGSNG